MASRVDVLGPRKSLRVCYRESEREREREMAMPSEVFLGRRILCKL